MLARLFRKEHSPEDRRDDEDTETLLPDSSNSPANISTVRKSKVRENRDREIAIRTLLLCTVVYAAAGMCMALGMGSNTLVEAADRYCLDYISHYCKSSRGER